MAVARALVPALALSGIAATLFFVSQFSAPLSGVFSLPLLSFWLFSWLCDARYTARHWRFVLNGYEANVLILALSRLAPRRPTLVIAAHMAFSLVAATALQAIVTHSFDLFLVSCILGIFGMLHLEALYHSRRHVTTTLAQEKQQQKTAEDEQAHGQRR